MASEPSDSFDNLPADVVRRGVHRGPRPRGRGWITFAWAALATGVLVGAGALGLNLINTDLSGSDSSSAGGAVSSDPATVTPTPTVVPTVDPAIPVTILNGTDVSGLATRAGGQATDAGWSVSTEANASATDVTTSTVFYSGADDEGAAKGLAESLGGIAVAVSDQYEAGTLTAVLGTDYTDPAG
ncbi:hypothetical protein B7R54_12655 [Subtercola boreus]|uniref:LytR/CpsA/Psr regulator C-terminal domain-containing protein n=1 Tax=Subtercola boreus TaxID=120213 RepID=A0A3E0VM40_9MICO|nr:LytR C-terminal domain-containing protein [Subtercola boreus]RFA09957.1 hypothetical protein B7R54_12655 [Subtercola boreus]TQL52901.1 LytR cell envelope-related transcriptional attenuator [Subtercola boreus]